MPSNLTTVIMYSVIKQPLSETQLSDHYGKQEQERPSPPPPREATLHLLWIDRPLDEMLDYTPILCWLYQEDRAKLAEHGNFKGVKNDIQFANCISEVDETSTEETSV